MNEKLQKLGSMSKNKEQDQKDTAKQFEDIVAQAEKNANVEIAKEKADQGGTFSKRRPTQVKRQDSSFLLDFVSHTTETERIIYQTVKSETEAVNEEKKRVLIDLISKKADTKLQQSYALKNDIKDLYTH